MYLWDSYWLLFSEAMAKHKLIFLHHCINSLYISSLRNSKSIFASLQQESSLLLSEFISRRLSDTRSSRMQQSSLHKKADSLPQQVEVCKLLKSEPVFCKKFTTNICTINNTAANGKFFVCLSVRIIHSCVLYKNCKGSNNCAGTIGNNYASLNDYKQLYLIILCTIYKNT